MKKPSGVPELETLLGHSFRQPELLSRALTHRSLAYEQRLAAAGTADVGNTFSAPSEIGSHPGSDPTADNEQLEFLGDAVVGFLVAEDLCRRYPELREGALTRLRAELVSRRHLGLVAARLNLGEYMLLGRGEERSGGRRKSALLANCMEAVVAALYLDAGIEITRAFVVREVVEPNAAGLRNRMLGGSSIGDHKSALQELLQARKQGQPEYSVRAESGPDHRKRFLVEVSLAKNGAETRHLARGLGSTKKKAEQEAARRAIIKLERAPERDGSGPELAPEAIEEIDSEA
ncbi:MAG TPA: ribonuclease III [Silvibacterium sp.]|nr:ribonuclease III [Silvibacterium sp.]